MSETPQVQSQEIEEVDSETWVTQGARQLNLTGPQLAQDFSVNVQQLAKRYQIPWPGGSNLVPSEIKQTADRNIQYYLLDFGIQLAADNLDVETLERVFSQPCFRSESGEAISLLGFLEDYYQSLDCHFSLNQRELTDSEVVNLLMKNINVLIKQHQFTRVLLSAETFPEMAARLRSLVPQLVGKVMFLQLARGGESREVALLAMQGNQGDLLEREGVSGLAGKVNVDGQDFHYAFTDTQTPGGVTIERLFGLLHELDHNVAGLVNPNPAQAHPPDTSIEAFRSEGRACALVTAFLQQQINLPDLSLEFQYLLTRYRYKHHFATNSRFPIEKNYPYSVGEVIAPVVQQLRPKDYFLWLYGVSSKVYEQGTFWEKTRQELVRLIEEVRQKSNG